MVTVLVSGPYLYLTDTASVPLALIEPRFVRPHDHAHDSEYTRAYARTERAPHNLVGKNFPTFLYQHPSRYVFLTAIPSQ